MTERYICGYLNLTTHAYMDVERPPVPANPSMYAWVGESAGGDNGGFKSKMDYHKNLWFMACDAWNGVSIMYLVRATKNPDDSVDLAYKQISLPPNNLYCATPNQLTIDKNDNVYFGTGGNVQPAQAFYYMAKVTNTQDPDPANWVITWYANAFVPTSIGTYGVSLSKDHSKIVTCVAGVTANSVLAVINTTTMVTAIEKDIGEYESPLNFETDVSGISAPAGNDNWAFCVGKTQGKIVGIDLTTPANALTKTDVISSSEKTLMIKTNGDVVTGWHDEGGVQHNYETLYAVAGSGTLAAGVQNEVFVPTYSVMNHGDIIRADANTRIWSSGYAQSEIQGQVREVTNSTQNQRVATADYRYISTACERETYT